MWKGRFAVLFLFMIAAGARRGKHRGAQAAPRGRRADGVGPDHRRQPRPHRIVDWQGRRARRASRGIPGMRPARRRQRPADTRGSGDRRHRPGGAKKSRLCPVWRGPPLTEGQSTRQLDVRGRAGRPRGVPLRQALRPAPRQDARRVPHRRRSLQHDDLRRPLAAGRIRTRFDEPFTEDAGHYDVGVRYSVEPKGQSRLRLLVNGAPGGLAPGPTEIGQPDLDLCQAGGRRASSARSRAISASAACRASASRCRASASRSARSASAAARSASAAARSVSASARSAGASSRSPVSSRKNSSWPPSTHNLNPNSRLSRPPA